MLINLPLEVLKAYEYLGEIITVEPINMGLINKTFIITTKKVKYILQEISPIFNDNVHQDFYEVSMYLQKKNVLAPQIIKTCNDNLFIKHNQHIYRAQSYIDGYSFNTITDLSMAFEAGIVIARFHHALMDFKYQYKNQRKTACDYAYHQEFLMQALKTYTKHDFFKQTQELASELFNHMSFLLPEVQIIKRHVHGDPKISNILFDKNNKGLCLVDFDTLSMIGFSAELADAIRSLSNPHKEDDLNSYCDLSIVKNLLQGYGTIMKGIITPLEISQITINTLAITLCLSMRYLTDVLLESYFSYDRIKFTSAAHHNWLRAQSMYRLFLDMKQKSTDLSLLCQKNLI